jgi:nucleotide-binding universal stress UspA family protein
MYLMKKVAVVLEMNESDNTVCDFAERIASRIEFDSIDFIHVVKNVELPKEITDQYPDLINPLDESIKEAMGELIGKYPSLSSHKNVSIQVLEGNRQKQLTDFARENDLDLLIIDQGEETKAHLNFLPKLARTLTCDIAIVPATVPDDIRQLLVPIDFSENSKMALEFAQLLASVDSNIRIHGLHIYKVPQGYRKLGKSYEEFQQIMRKNAQSELKKFFKEHAIDHSQISMNFIHQSGDNIPTMINRFALSNKVDMILAGSRGNNTLSSFLLGNIAESLITKEHYLPLIIVKNKGASVKLWEALMQI